ncbi:hypothetical protein FHX57_007748 [Paraburkholderia tropica]|nr:hypothetical protein [Paraburkholderia tropica]MBB6323544.1 hypothetical protein [Paraburkholderia tropica]
MAAPRPLDVLELPDDLDGRTGVNRATGRRQIDADNDLAAVRAWPARVAATKTTFDNYRKEAERLLLWSIVQLGKPLSSLTHEDLLADQRFLADPQPRTHWVSGGEDGAGRKFQRDDARWSPFHGPLASTSQRQVMVILDALSSWLVGAGYLAGNPLSLSRQRTHRAAPRVTRFLERDLWQEVKVYIDSLPVRRTVSANATGARVGSLPSSTLADCASLKSVAIPWGAASADVTPTVTSAGGSRSPAKATATGSLPPPTR